MHLCRQWSVHLLQIAVQVERLAKGLYRLDYLLQVRCLQQLPASSWKLQKPQHRALSLGWSRPPLQQAQRRRPATAPSLHTLL